VWFVERDHFPVFFRRNPLSCLSREATGNVELNDFRHKSPLGSYVRLPAAPAGPLVSDLTDSKMASAASRHVGESPEISLNAVRSGTLHSGRHFSGTGVCKPIVRARLTTSDARYPRDWKSHSTPARLRRTFRWPPWRQTSPLNLEALPLCSTRRGMAGWDGFARSRRG